MTNYHDSLVDDIQDTIMKLLIKEDPSAALMLACTSWKERRRYHHMSLSDCPDAKKLVWRDGLRVGILAGHLELSKALLAIYGAGLDRMGWYYEEWDYVAPALASPNPDILSHFFGESIPWLKKHLQHYVTISWPVFERYFVDQIESADGAIEIKHYLARAVNADWISSLVATCLKLNVEKGRRFRWDECYFISQYGRLKDVQAVLS
jgi:hypothetical protein